MDKATLLKELADLQESYDWACGEVSRLQRLVIQLKVQREKEAKAALVDANTLPEGGLLSPTERIRWLEDKEAYYIKEINLDASRIERLQARVSELEKQLLDSDEIFVREIGRQQARILDLEAKEGYLERRLVSANKEINQQQMRTLDLDIRALELEEHLVDTEKAHAYEHREVGCIHRELVDLVGAVALLMEEMGDRTGVLEE